VCRTNGLILAHLSYHLALVDQPHKQILPEPFATVVPIALFLLGQLFVVTSTWALGITGTFLGDYFGILMDHRVEGFVFLFGVSCVYPKSELNSSVSRFPFNVLRDPMYVGSTLCFAATALW